MRSIETAPHVLGPGMGERVAFLGHDFLFKGTAATTGGAFSAIEIVQRRGGEPPRHVHHREDEAFYVLEGEMTFHVGDEVLPAPAGSFVFLPRDVPHTFTVNGDGVARVLQLCSPAGVERFFSEWSDRPLDVPAMATALDEYGVEIVGPPPR
ncbi:MAG TPA: cupin domain-containing protein [Solirubrobacteraceae bacterium]